MEKHNSILIVDDDPSSLMELVSILKPLYKVYAVKDALSALSKANDARPDLILLDVVMPDMSGFEVLKELKKSEAAKNIPVIFITGVTDTESENEGLSIGAADYIHKPFNAKDVERRVRAIIK
jgi:DNA-binding response OmpR family regulator